MAKTFSLTERNILNICENGSKFIFEEEVYEIIESGKPRGQGSGGEPKTDIYILAKSIKQNINKEFKISFKQKNYDFLENKISYERAEQILGSNASKIIFNSIQKIKSSFEEEYLIFLDKRGNTDKGSITLGWKFEFLKVLSGKKAGKIELNENQKIDIFSGSNLKTEFKNAVVNDKIIENSGVANFIFIDNVKNIDLQKFISNLKEIEIYSKNNEIYFACKALNLRTSKNKWDGDRPLAVYVDWTLDESKKLVSKIVYDKPLEKKGNEIGNNVKKILESLKIDYSNFNEIEYIVFNKKTCFKK